MSKGLFVVCEGMDAAGKTTSMAKAIEEYKNSYNSDILYNKGLKSNTCFGMISRRLPSTLTILVEQLYQDVKIIKPALRKDSIILQDRWYYSVLSYNDKKEKLLEKLFTSILSKPDAFVYFTVSLDERMNRLLKENKKNEHHMLIEHPEIIQEQEQRLLAYYNNFKGPKIIIDTTNKSEKQSGHELYNYIITLKSECLETFK